MASSREDRITCPSCGRRYVWKPQFAGRKVRCKCGESMRMPKPTATDDGTYDLDLEKTDAPREPLPSEAGRTPAHGGKCPSCGTAISQQAVVCVQCGFDLKEGRRIETSLGQAVKNGGPPVRRQAEAADGFFGRISRSWQFAKILKR